jgi:conjugative relaxase-like TrwC/TraI family protein
MLTIRAMSDGRGYSARYLEQRDYYAEGERVLGLWRGRGAELLGLSGDVRTVEFEALRQGCDPRTGEFLRQRQSADRTATDGTTQSRGRNLYDFTFSAPKSVSILASLGQDDRLTEAHRRAVDETLKELETCAQTRVRQDGANEDRRTGNMVLAVYQHDTSRELDPQLHTHAVAANLTYDGTEGRWKALQASEIYDNRAYLTEVYRNALAREVRRLGYEIFDRRDGRGRNQGFEIRGISERLLEDFSQRSAQRNQAIAEFVQQTGRQPSDNEVAILVRESRADKQVEIATEEVRRRQRARLTRENERKLTQLREAALARPEMREKEQPSAAASLEYAQRHIFERVSVARVDEVLAEALRYGRGRVGLGELKGHLALQESAGTVLRAGREVATRASLDREQEMVERLNRGLGRFESLGAQDDFIVSDRLRPEQKNVIHFLLDSRDLAVNLRGAAGTGKTATLQELHRGLREAGRRVLAVAPTMSAVEELQKVGFASAMSLEKLLQDQKAHREMWDGAVIVDEAGMVSGNQMSQLLGLAERQSARIVFSGDTRQIQSVEACDALRVLEKESRLKSCSLTQVQRQTALQYREAIQELRRSPELGFHKLEEIGAIHEVAWRDKARAVQQAYTKTLAQPNGHGQERSVLVVCATHEEIGIVTAAIRKQLIGAGTLGQSALLERNVPLNWTTAHKGDARNFHEGQILEFHRAVKGAAKNETLEVVGIRANQIVARNTKGEEREFTGKQARCFDVYERRNIEVAPNDRLLLTANRREAELRVTNGELVTVSGVDGQGWIQLRDGRVLPEAYRHFDHGYAVTAHRSQGKSVDAVVISGDAMKKELFYVAASRGRESVTVVTSDRELLRESVARSGARQSASELARKVQRRTFQQGELRGLSAARRLARDAAVQSERLEKRVMRSRELDHEVTRKVAAREYQTERKLERGGYDIGR